MIAPATELLGHTRLRHNDGWHHLVQSYSENGMAEITKKENSEIYIKVMMERYGMQRIIMEVRNSEFANFLLIRVTQTIILISLLACSYSKPNKAKFPNPYWETLLNKNIKMMICIDGRDSTSADTIWFDKERRVTRTKHRGYKSVTEYDENNYPIRLFEKSDIFNNLLASYKIDGEGNLIQTWRTINSSEWDYKDSDVDTSVFSTFKYKMDKKGRIISQELPDKSYLYVYDEEGRLKKQIVKYSTGETIDSFSYDRSGLRRIDETKDHSQQFSHFFSNGLLDSTVYKDYSIRCKYVFW